MEVSTDYHTQVSQSKFMIANDFFNYKNVPIEYLLNNVYFNNQNSPNASMGQDSLIFPSTSKY